MLELVLYILEPLLYILAFLACGFFLMIGVVIMVGSIKADRARLEAGRLSSGTIGETFLGDEPKEYLPFKDKNILSAGMSRDKKTGKIIRKSKLSDAFVDSIFD